MEKEQKVTYIKYDLPTKGTLILSRELQGQIDHLHSKVGNIEWIGVLLHNRLEGDITDPTKLVIKAERLLLMDIGTAGHTEAEMETEDVLELFDSGLRQGLIHTHHNMTAFFSAEDWSELNDNTPQHNYYLSLIVNNDGKYVAKIAYMADDERSFKFRNADDLEVINQINKKVMVVMDMTIHREDLQVDQKFLDRYELIKQRIEDAKKPKYTVTSYGGPYNTWPQNHWKGEDFSLPEKKQVIGEVDHTKKTFPGKNGGNYYKHPKDSLTYQQAKTIILDWLNEGLRMESIDATTPFNTMYQGVDYFAKYYEGKHESAEYKRFLDMMQKTLVDVSAEFQPSVTSKRVSVQLREIMYAAITDGYEIVKDLAMVAECHPTYLQILRQEEKEERKNGAKRGLEQRTIGFYGY